MNFLHPEKSEVYMTIFRVILTKFAVVFCQTFVVFKLTSKNQLKQPIKWWFKITFKLVILTI